MTAVILTLLVVLGGVVWDVISSRPTEVESTLGVSSSQPDQTPKELAAEALAKLPVKGRAPKTGYSRTQFGGDWGTVGSCDLRNLILQRDLLDVKLADDGCIVTSGRLNQDPYTGGIIEFKRGSETSQAVQIDHVVAVSDAWQKGAQNLPRERREAFYNDPLNLLAVDGPTNMKKGDGDAATWLPPNKLYRCRYVARQIAVKIKYALWVTAAETSAIKQILKTCPTQTLPIASEGTR